MVNKKVVLIMSILTIIITGIIVYFSLKPLQNIKYTFGDEEFESKTSIINSNVENIKDDEKTDSKEKEANEEEKKSSDSKENKSTEPEVKKTGKELAVEMAKKEWGESDTSVYYYVEEKKSEDIYIISVRNRETTVGMMDYEVNIKDGTVEEY